MEITSGNLDVSPTDVPAISVGGWENQATLQSIGKSYPVGQDPNSVSKYLQGLVDGRRLMVHMDTDYIRPDLAGARILINPIWEELCIVLKEIQSGCRLNRIPEPMLRKFYEKSKKEGFFSGFLMTADKAPDGYGYLTKQQIMKRFKIGTSRFYVWKKSRGIEPMVIGQVSQVKKDIVFAEMKKGS